MSALGRCLPGVAGRNGAADRTRTYYPIITNDVLYLMSYSGILLFFHDPTMALLIILMCLGPYGFASHSRGEPLITNALVARY